MKLLKRTYAEFKVAPGLYIASTIVITLCLTIFAFFGLIYLNLLHFTKEVAKELVLNVYLSPNVSKEQVEELTAYIKKDPLVAGVRFIPAEEVLEELKKLFEDPTLLEGVKVSYLPPVLVVSFKDPFKAGDYLPILAGSLERRPETEKVQYAHSWLMRLKRLKRFLQLISLSGLILLGSATIFIVALTVHFSLSERREEIEILSLVGATPGFIQAPLMLLAFLEGLVASVLALLLLLVLKFYLEFISRGLLPGFKKGWVFFNHWEIAILTIGVVTLCLIGSYWASRRFLRY